MDGRSRSCRRPRWAAVVCAIAMAGCRSDGGDSRGAAGAASVEAGRPATIGCRRNAECNWLGSSGDGPYICGRATQTCVSLVTEDCRSWSGPHLDDDAILVGSLFSLRGGEAGADLQRQRSTELAVEEIDQAGGIPVGPDGARRPLVMVACDASLDVARAARHLVSDLGAHAIVGPSSSQDTLDLALKYSIGAGTLIMSPTALAASIADLSDDDLVWQAVPADDKRVTLMNDQLRALERELMAERTRSELRLGIVMQDDALGRSARGLLSGIELNGKRLTDPANFGEAVQIDAYDPHSDQQDALVARYVEFAPDLIWLVGGAEAVTTFIAPLEQQLKGTDPSHPRPHYLLTDASKVPELLDLTAHDEELRRRIRGTGLIAGSSSQPVFADVMGAYRLRYADAPSTISGIAAAHDATYALAFALAAERSDAISGEHIARGLRRLGQGGPDTLAFAADLPAIFRTLAAGTSINLIGSLAPYAWDENGSQPSGVIEMWCIERGADGARFAGSGLSFDLATQQSDGQYTPCASVEPAGSDPGVAIDPSEPPPMAAPDSEPDMPTAESTLDEDAGIPDVPEETGPAPEGTFEIGRTIDSEWGTGYCATIVVQNTAARAYDWTTRQLIFDGAIDQLWSAISDVKRGVVTFSGVAFNKTLAAGATTSFGYCVARWNFD